MEDTSGPEAVQQSPQSEENDSKIGLMDQQNEENTLLSTPATPKTDKSPKVTVMLYPVGGAPIIKQKKWEVESSKTVGFISNFIRRYLKLQKSDSLFFYVYQSNQPFAPSLDQSVQNLYDCFGSDGKLILRYCLTQAWG